MRQGHPGRDNEEVLINRPDGTEAWTLVSWTPMHDASGALLGYLHRLTEYTARRRLLVALQDREQQLADAQRIARLGSWTWDLEADRIVVVPGVLHRLRPVPGPLRGDLDVVPLPDPPRRPRLGRLDRPHGHPPARHVPLGGAGPDLEWCHPLGARPGRGRARRRWHRGAPVRHQPGHHRRPLRRRGGHRGDPAAPAPAADGRGREPVHHRRRRAGPRGPRARRAQRLATGVRVRAHRARRTALGPQAARAGRWAPRAGRRAGRAVLAGQRRRHRSLGRPSRPQRGDATGAVGTRRGLRDPAARRRQPSPTSTPGR